jgi:hypothetical protein
MEFLMTYGWALLVVLIAIGALAFFGVLNPSKFLPNSCSLAPGFSCNDFKAAATGGAGGASEVRIVIQNGLGDNLNSVTLSLANSNPICTVASGTSTGGPFTGGSSITDGSSATYFMTCTSTLTKGTKLKGDLQIAYTIGSGTGALPHNKVGQLVVGIEA